MKNLLLGLTLLTSFSQAYALVIDDRNVMDLDKCGSETGEVFGCAISTTTSPLTVLVADSEVNINSEEGAAHLLQEAMTQGDSTPVTDRVAKELGVDSGAVMDAVIELYDAGSIVNMDSIANTVF